MRKVLIASVLKPVTDPRMYGKIGKSLAESNELEVHLAGYHAQLPAAKKVNFYPLFKFNRLSFQRLVAPFQIFFLLLRIRPEVFIACTHELLFVAILYKVLFKGRIYYDVQENYFRNILYMKTFPFGIRYALAFFVRVKEKLSAPYFDGFILAERVYQQQLRFVQERCFIAENLFQPSTDKIKAGKSEPTTGLRFLYTGTVAEEYGVFEAIDLIKKIHAYDSRASLIIFGFTQSKSVLQRIYLETHGFNYINARISEVPIPHSEILAEMKKAHFLMLPYRKNKATAGKIPTKLFEALYLKVPFIAQKDQLFEQFAKHFDAGVFIDFRKVDAKELTDSLKNKPFFNIPIPDDLILWEPVGKELAKWIDQQS